MPPTPAPTAAQRQIINFMLGLAGNPGGNKLYTRYLSLSVYSWDVKRVYKEVVKGLWIHNLQETRMRETIMERTAAKKAKTRQAENASHLRASLAPNADCDE